MAKKKRKTAKKKPVVATARKKRRTNPATISEAALRRAEQLYTSFKWGDVPKNILAMKLTPPKENEPLVCLGRLRAVEYDSDKSGKNERYKHSFKRDKVNGWPLLVSTADGKQLFVLGGGYKVEERGIVG